MSAARVVTLLTDFGLVDDFAGVCHAVILARAPGTQVVHLTHGITPHSVLQGALVLRNTLAYTPTGVHMAIVDPGVGTDRRAIAVESGDGRLFVGPDNGLLAPAIAANGGAVRAVSLENEELQLTPVAPTFHGRDVFAPAAAHLAAGGELGELGPAVAVDSLASLDVPAPRARDGVVEAQVWNIDRFGNIALLLDEPTLRAAVGEPGVLELAVRNDRFYASWGGTFASVRMGEILVYVDPYGSVSVAVNRGDAAQMFRLAPGSKLSLRAAPDGTQL